MIIQTNRLNGRTIDPNSPLWSVLTNGFEEFNASAESSESNTGGENQRDKMVCGDDTEANKAKKFDADVFERSRRALCVVCVFGSDSRWKRSWLEGGVLRTHGSEITSRVVFDEDSLKLTEYSCFSSPVNSDGPLVVLDLEGDPTDMDRISKFVPLVYMIVSLCDVVCVCDRSVRWLTSDFWLQMLRLTKCMRSWMEDNRDYGNPALPRLVIISGGTEDASRERDLIESGVRDVFTRNRLTLASIEQMNEFVWIEKPPLVVNWMEAIGDLVPRSREFDSTVFSRNVRSAIERVDRVVSSLERSIRLLTGIVDDVIQSKDGGQESDGHVLTEFSSNMDTIMGVVSESFVELRDDDNDDNDGSSSSNSNNNSNDDDDDKSLRCYTALRKAIEGNFGGIDFVLDNFQRNPPTLSEYEQMTRAAVQRMQNELITEFSAKAFDMYLVECDHIINLRPRSDYGVHYNESIHSSVTEKVIVHFRNLCGREFAVFSSNQTDIVDVSVNALKAKLDNFWRSEGRQSCENRSLTGHDCVRAKHVNNVHDTAFHFQSASDCGRAQAVRPDPFDLNEANRIFYKNLSEAISESKKGWLMEYEKLIAPVNQQLRDGSNSWTLCRIGDFFHYDHDKGLTKQPGFLIPANFLAPLHLQTRNLMPSAEVLDCVDQGDVAFVGCEYECQFGHRFISVQPDTLTSPNMNPVQSNFLTQSLPMYTKCPERSRNMNHLVGTSHMAQLMRIFVVIPPESPDLALRPRVRHGNSGPVFSPVDEERILLKNDSFWVLRLPFIYHTNEQTMLRPRTDQPNKLWPHDPNQSTNTLSGHELLSGCVEFV